MNTPTHVLINSALLSDRTRSDHWRPIVFGAALPDFPMVGFYVYQRLFVGRSEADIWNHLYFDATWQAFFDSFNSIPIALAGLLVAGWFGRRGWQLLFASVLLHCLGDLPFHHEDAHRHFYPFSDWRFLSPVSYWDPKRHGNIIAPLELVTASLTAIAMCVKGRRRCWRGVGAITIAIYAVFIAFVLTYWVGAS